MTALTWRNPVVLGLAALALVVVAAATFAIVPDRKSVV